MPLYDFNLDFEWITWRCFQFSKYRKIGPYLTGHRARRYREEIRDFKVSRTNPSDPLTIWLIYKGRACSVPNGCLHSRASASSTMTEATSSNPKYLPSYLDCRKANNYIGNCTSQQRQLPNGQPSVLGHTLFQGILTTTSKVNPISYILH